MRLFLTIFLFTFLFASRAWSLLASEGYMSDFFYRQCANTNLMIPGADSHNLISEPYTLGIVDSLNENATDYAADSPFRIVSVAYLDSILPKLKDSKICCLGGYYDNPAQDCLSCGEWLVESTNLCFEAGVYYNNGTCSSCGDGYICQSGTSGRVNCGAGYWCRDNTRTACEYGTRQCPGVNLTEQPDTIGCDYSTVVSVSDADRCIAAGVYYNNGTCSSCGDGYICAYGTSGRVNCGAGYWCRDNVRTACEYGTRQCPGVNLTEQPDTIGCDYSTVVSVSDADRCIAAGVYYNNGTCSACGDGYICAAGTSGRVNCGAGYWCRNNVRTACEYGVSQCPGINHTAQPDTVACDGVLVFSI